jgi:hypothetical protein
MLEMSEDFRGQIISRAIRNILIMVVAVGFEPPTKGL